MAGHSKWANIQHRKNRQDEKRGKVFTLINHEITIATKSGSGYLAVNLRAHTAMDKDRDLNLSSAVETVAKKREQGWPEDVAYASTRNVGIGHAAVDGIG